MQLLKLKNILVATELGDVALPAVVAASELAAAAGGALHAVSVATSDARQRGDGPGTTEAKATLAAILNRAGAHTDDSRIHVLEGDAAFEIGALARRVHADVIVLGPHRERQPEAGALGSTALGVVTNVSSPCMVVSTPIRLPLRRVLVPVDLSDTARGAVLVGLSWASALRGGSREGPEHADVDLTVLYVRKDSHGADASSQPQALERELDYMRKQSGTWAGVSIHGQTIVSTDATQGIVDYVGENACDLVVMGTRGLGLDPVGRLGSIAASVIKVIAAPVLLVPPAVWIAHARTS